MIPLGGVMLSYLRLSFVVAVTLNSHFATGAVPVEEDVTMSPSMCPGNREYGSRSSHVIRRSTQSDHTSSKAPEKSIDQFIVTPYLDVGLNNSQIRERSSVPPLMGEVRSYSGFFTVNKTHNSNLFFWFFESDSDYENRPLVLWLQGGPGDPFVNALFLGNGPYQYTKNGKVLPSPTSWTTKVNMLYIDNPVGAGYSFTDSENGYCTTVEGAATNVYVALLQFYQVFPELRRNKLYLAGESFAGKFLPTLASIILRENRKAEAPPLNLVGVSIGCGFIDPVNQMYFADYYYQLGLLDESTRSDVLIVEEKIRKHIKQGNMYTALALTTYLFTKAYFLDLYPSLDARGQSNYSSQFLEDLAVFMESEKMRRRLHVGSQPFHGKAKVMWHFRNDFLKSVSGHVEELLRHCKLLLYAGQFDSLVPSYQTDKVIKALSWPDKEKFYKATRSKWYVAGELAGFRKSAGNLTQVLVRDSSHFIMRTQPTWVRDMFFDFLNS